MVRCHNTADIMNANNQKWVKQRQIKKENKNESRITRDIVSSTTKNIKGNNYFVFEFTFANFEVVYKYNYAAMRGSG